MQHSRFLLAALPALFLAVPAAASTPPAQGEVILRIAPPSSNPKDVFRRIIKVQKPVSSLAMSMKDCVCPSEGDGAVAPETPAAPSSGK